MNEFNSFLYGREYPIVKWEETEDINFWIEQQNDFVMCHKCGSKCNKYHETHTRKIQDTPIHNKKVFININVREFIRENDECKINTFTEELPFVGKNQVRTYALTEFILIHAIYISSNSTSLILSLMGVDVSADTVDNILKKVEVKDNPDVEMIGIDDVSLRKGITYATAIYDLKDHHLIALLKGREKEDIIPWLKKHPKIIFVARDRASAYAKAIDEILPNAIQVADRFHLFENIIEYSKDLLYSSIPDKIVIKDNEVLDKKAKKVIKELSNIDENILNELNYNNTPPIDDEGNIIEYHKYLYDMNDEEHKKQSENRIKKYNEVLNIRNDSKFLTIDQLTKKYNRSKPYITKYINIDDEDVEKIKIKRNYKLKNKTNFDEYINIIYKMLKDNIPDEYIMAYILKCGYKGTLIQLKGVIYRVAKNNNIKDTKINIYSKYEYPKDETVITRYELLKYILTIDVNKEKNKIINDNLKNIESKFPIVQKIRIMFEDFHNTIFSKDTELIDIFIEMYSDLLPSFCNGLKKDIAAVKFAISNPINSGFVEGNNNKFKLIKRIVYGKQKLVNLFKRCYLAFASTLEDLSLLKLAINPLISK